MLKTLFWACWLFVYLIRKMPLYWKLRRLQKQGREEERLARLDAEVKLWCRRLMKHVKTNLVVEGAENLPGKGEPALFVSNHQSYLDIPLLLYALGEPHPLMAKKEIRKVPMLGGWLEQLGCVLVDRDDVRASLRAMREGEEYLMSGGSLILFPEGTRSQSNEMTDFKPGGLRMAKKSGVPIVPVAIDGGYLILEGNDYKLQPVDARVVILPPVETKNLSRDEMKTIGETLRAQIEAAKENRPPNLLPPRV